MSDIKNLVKLAKQVYKNRFSHEEYSVNDANEVLRQALIDANGGSTKLDYKQLRKNGAAIFEIIEEILENTVLEGLPEDNFFQQFVEYKNVALGDENSFYIPDNTMLTVSEIADGVQTIRRQRLDVGHNVSLHTSWKGIKIYEHLSRILSGRVDFNELINALEKAFIQKITDDAYDAFVNSFNQLPPEFTDAGNFDEDILIDLVEHVEAATGKSAIIAGTRKALRKIANANPSDSALEDMYKLGYFGAFYGTPMIRIKQVHEVGTFTFKLSDSDVYIVTTDEKPVKFVTEGEVRVIEGDPTSRADLTQEYFSATKYGVGVVVTDLYGKYEIA